jgi:glutamyl-tRNA synthetase
LDGVNKSPASFSYDKLEWMNGAYIRELSQDALYERLIPFLASSLGMEERELRERKETREIMPLIQERIKKLTDAVELVDFFFVDQISYDPSLLVGKKMTAAESLAALRKARETLAALPDFEEETLEEALRALVQELGLKAGQLFGIIRVAATGKKVAPPLFGTLSILGRERVLERLDKALEKLKGI